MSFRFLLICMLLVVGHSASNQVFAQKGCTLRVSAVDVKNNSILDVNFILVDHKSLSTSKKTAADNVEFELIKDVKYSVKAKKEGYFLSVMVPPNPCNATAIDLKIPLIKGDHEKEVFIVGNNPTRNSEGKIVFDAENVYAIGKSWPKPSYSRQCRVQCEVFIGLRIDETGYVTEVKFISGNSDLKSSVESAALKSVFRPVFYDGKFVPVNAVMRYVFR